jgi:hypothetical protein
MDRHEPVLIHFAAYFFAGLIAGYSELGFAPGSRLRSRATWPV